MVVSPDWLLAETWKNYHEDKGCDSFLLHVFRQDDLKESLTESIKHQHCKGQLQQIETTCPLQRGPNDKKIFQVCLRWVRLHRGRPATEIVRGGRGGGGGVGSLLRGNSPRQPDDPDVTLSSLLGTDEKLQSLSPLRS